MAHELEKNPKELQDHLKRFQESQKKYELEAPPKGYRFEGTKTWEEFREEQLEYTKWHIESVEEAIKRTKEHENKLRKKFGSQLNDLKKYCKWIEKQRGFPRHPDFIATKNEKIYIIEVKSKSKGKTAFFSEHQRKSLLKACDFNLVPMLIEIPIDINIEIGEPQFIIGKENFL